MTNCIITTFDNDVICFLGDSITEGAGVSNIAENRYDNRLKKAYGLKANNNYGIGGTRLARTTVPNVYHRLDIDFNLRVPLFDKNVDKFFVFGGTNDFGHGSAPMGKEGDYDEYTFHGAVNKLFSTLLGMYGRGYYNNAILADPLFKDAQNRDFTLAENSPALDGGFEPWEYNAGTITEINVGSTISRRLAFVQRSTQEV